jgi:nicotinamidase/pyrazinamidase
MKTIFWNVDTQYDFMRTNGEYQGLLVIPRAQEIEPNLALLTELARSKGKKVVNTADWHNEQSAELSDKPDFFNTFPVHCMEFTKGAEFVPVVRPVDPYVIDWKQESFDAKEVARRRELVLYKDKFDVFTGTKHADAVVKLLQPDRAIVYGVATNVCVDCAVRGLLERKIQVYVPTDAIKELPNIPLPYENWKKLGAILTTTNEVYSLLEESR